MPISIRQFEPRRAVEVIEERVPNYGSGYRIGGRLILTAAHLLGVVGSACMIRDKQSFGEQSGLVVWKAKGSDIALIELPEGIAEVAPVTLGHLPEATAGETLAFQMYAYPTWARTQRERGSVVGGRQIEGTIFLADYSPDRLLVLEPSRLPPEVVTTDRSQWAGSSGAAIVCDGLIIAVKHWHQNPSRPASLDASPLSEVYGDEQWRRLLEKHGIAPEPVIVGLPIADKPLTTDWHRISVQLLEERLRLTTNPIMRGENIADRVDQMYVPLGLMERKKVPRRSQDVSPERGSTLYREPQPSETEEVELIQRFEYDQFLEQVLQRRQSPKSQGKRVAIIGEPGAGKTTLLQQIAQWVAKTLPESVVIWVSLADLQSDSLEAYLEKRWLQSVIREAGGAEVSPIDQRGFAEQFKQGHVWLLLDGLDEMQVSGNPLSNMQRQIQEGGWLQPILVKHE